MRAISFTASLVAAASIVTAAAAAPPQTAALIYTLQTDKARLSAEDFDRTFQEKYEGKAFLDTGTVIEFEENRSWLFGVSYFAPVATAHGEVRCALSADDIDDAVAAKTGDRVRVSATLSHFTDRIEIAQCKFKVLSRATVRPPSPAGIAAQAGVTATPGAVNGKVFADIARLRTASDRDALLDGIHGKPFADSGLASTFADGTFCRMYRTVHLRDGSVYCCLTARDLRPFAQFPQGQSVRVFGKVAQWTQIDGSIGLSACRIERR